MKATMPKMPRAEVHRATWDGAPGWTQYHDKRDPFPEGWDDDEAPDEVMGFYSGDQLRARDAAVWALAMEQAAQAARDELMPKNERGDWTQYAHDMAGAANRTAAAIRSLPMPAAANTEEKNG